MTISEIVNSCLPVTVGANETNDPMFAIYDENRSWALSIACPWTISGPGFEYQWDDETFGLAIDRLFGASLIRVEIGEDLVDPIFHFSNGVELAVHADTDLDPWVFRLPRMEFVLVGLAPPPTRDR